MEKRPPLNNAQQVLALQLFDLGAVKIAGPDEAGFTLKLHEQHPEAPKSPIYFNLRTSDNPKPGPLTDAVLQEIGIQLQLLARTIDYDIVVPVPNAGEPFAQAFIAALPNRSKTKRPPLVRMIKETGATERRIVSLRADELPPRRALLIDDLISGADSKLEAVNAVRSAGLDVQHCLVLLDREQGGGETLRAHGVELHATFVMTDIVRLYHEAGRISWPTVNRVFEYFHTLSAD